jgi:hypothetical protein
VAAYTARPDSSVVQSSRLELNTNEISEGGVKEIGALLEGKGLGGVLGEMDENEGEEEEEEEDGEEEDEDGEEAGGEAAEGLDELIAGVENVKV